MDNFDKKCAGEIEKVDISKCWTPNGSLYPLCIGNGSDLCKDCCLYENMEEPPFDN